MATAVREDTRSDLSDVESDDLLNLYLGEVGHIPLLDAEQELELVTVCRRGEEARERLAQRDCLGQEERERLEGVVQEGNQARTQLITANSRLVLSIAKNFLGLGVPFLDLVQEGNLGLMRAIEKFNPELGYRLSTYATWWIRQAVSRAIAAQGRNIRLPVNKLWDTIRLRRTSSRIKQQLHREPTTEELADALEMDENKVEQLIEISRRTTSLDRPISHDSEGTLSQFVADERSPLPDEMTTRHLVRSSIEEALSSLTPRQERVLRLRYGLEDGEPHTLREIGDKFGLTRERIRQIEREALRRLRHPSRSRKLIGYLE